MHVSLSSVINTFFIGNLLILLLIFVISCKPTARRINIYTIVFCFLAILFRLLFPVEFFFTKTINITKIYPDFYVFLVHMNIYAGTFKIGLVKLLFINWGIVSVLLLCKSALHYGRIRRELLSLDHIDDPKIRNVYSRLNSTYKRPADFTLVMSPSLKTPLVFGLKKPVIALPQIAFTHRDLYFIVSHELCHYYRKHLHIKLLCEIINNIYFWNPFVYIMKWQINKSLELYVDERVTHPLTELHKMEYVECLLKIARLPYTNKTLRPYASSFAVLSDNLTERSARLLEDPCVHRKKLVSNAFLLLMMTLLVLTYLFIGEASSETDYVKNYTFTLDETNSYLVKKDDQFYDLYVNNKYIATVPPNFDPKIPIRKDNLP